MKKGDFPETQLKSKKPGLPEIVGRIMDGFFALDIHWRYTFMNKKAGEVLQLDPDAIADHSIWDEFPDSIGQPFHRPRNRNAPGSATNYTTM
jgi:PAS domain-containing protein